MDRCLPIKIDLPEGFLDREIRCGYEISPKLKKIWAVELDLLEELKRVCKKYGLTYHLAYGSMIGAVRHHGFIPWDDDMDVWLLREDYDKLCAVASQEFAYPYFLQTNESDSEYFNDFIRIRNSETTALVTGKSGRNYNSGIFIDIYPLDGMPRGKVMDCLQRFLIRTAIRGANASCQKAKPVGGWRKRLAWQFRWFFKLLPYASWCRMHRKALMMFNGRSRMVMPIFSLSESERRQRMTDAEFRDTIEVPYEFTTATIPAVYDRILRSHYGEYMEFPPVSRRGQWHTGEIIFEPDIPYKDYLLKR